MPRAARIPLRPPSRTTRNKRRVHRLWRTLLAPELFRNIAHYLRSNIAGILKLGCCLVTLAIVTLGYHWLTTTERFAISTLEVIGTKQLTVEEVQNQLQSATIGKNIFRIQLPAIRDTVNSDPWVESAVVKRVFPNRLRITVKEHQPRALIELGGLYLVNSNAKVFKRAALSLGEGIGLPVVTGMDRSHFIENKPGLEQKILNVLSILDIYQQSKKRPSIGEVHLDYQKGTVLVTLESATAIRIGVTRALANLPAKFRAFDTAWAALSPSQQNLAHTVHLTQNEKTDRVTVSFRNRKMVN